MEIPEAARVLITRALVVLREWAEEHPRHRHAVLADLLEFAVTYSDSDAEGHMKLLRTAVQARATALQAKATLLATQGSDYVVMARRLFCELVDLLAPWQRDEGLSTMRSEAERHVRALGRDPT